MPLRIVPGMRHPVSCPFLLSRGPGLLVAGALATLACAAASLPPMRHAGLSPLTLAMLAGMAFGQIAFPRLAPRCHAGVAFAKQALLRMGIVLFGFRLSLHDIAAVGWPGLLIDVLVLVSTFGLAYWVGRRRWGMDEHSVILIGAGSSICGAAAVLATEPIVGARPEKVTVAVATVVVFGTLAMFLWPLLYRSLHGWGLSDVQYGLFAGSTIHELAQAAVAGQSVSPQAMNVSVIAKMLRVMLLAPFLMALSWWLARRAPAHSQAHRTTRLAVPWFALAFVAATIVHAWVPLPRAWLAAIGQLDQALLATAMAALGLTTSARAILAAGWRPMSLAAILFTWLIVGGALINAGVWLLVR